MCGVCFGENWIDVYPSMVVIVEMFMPDDEPTGPVMLLDLAMMVIMDSKERTNAEFASLCASAGLKVTRTIPTGSAFGIIEAEAL